MMNASSASSPKPPGATIIHASHAVIFGSGGFTHNADLRRSYLHGPVFGGCAAIANEGDFVPIAQAVGADMCNMAESWNVLIQLERALAGDPTLQGTFSLVETASWPLTATAAGR